MVSLTLRFSTVECLRCGAMRQTRFPCPDCGKAAAITEMDLHVQKRQQSVQAAVEAHVSEADSLRVSAEELIGDGRLASLPDRTFAAGMRVAGGDPDGVTELVAIAHEIASLEKWVDEVSFSRPTVVLTQHVQVAVNSLVNVYDLVVRALSAESITDAQQANEGIQDALDRAGEAARLAGDILERVSRILEGGDPIGDWLALALNDDPIGASARGQGLFLTNTRRSCGPGTGLAALTCDVMASTIADPDEFWRLVRGHIALLESIQAPAVTAIVSDPTFTERLSEVTHDVWSAARRAAVSPDTDTLREEAGQLLEAGHLIVEQAIKFHLGVACAGTTKMTFERTQASDVSELANVASDKGWDVVGALGDSGIRNAFAHRDYDVRGDDVYLSPRQRHRDGRPEAMLSLLELQDSVLQFVEASMAMELALIAIGENLGLEGHVSPQGTFLVKSALIGIGWTQVDTRNHDGILIVSATVNHAVPLPLIAFAVQPVVGTTRRVDLHLRRSDTRAEVTIEIPVETYAIWAATAE